MPQDETPSWQELAGLDEDPEDEWTTMVDKAQLVEMTADRDRWKARARTVVEVAWTWRRAYRAITKMRSDDFACLWAETATLRERLAEAEHG